MSREQNGNPPQPEGEPEPASIRPHDPMERDATNPESAPSRPANEPKTGEANEGWDWAEHED
jgi:hypothetical protein